LEKEKLEKIIKIDNEKINQSRKIDEISYTIDKAKVEKRLLLDEYQEKAKKIDNMSSNEEIL
jgi:predicted  nucleic acid-binding Zn-ribbon protein